MKRRKCRLWWPEQLSSCNSISDLILFGWHVHDLYSIDIVVSAATSPSKISGPPTQLDLQEVLNYSNGKLPLPLRESAAFNILGHCAADSSIGDPVVDYWSKHSSFESDCRKLHSVGDEDNVTSETPVCIGVSQQCSHRPSIQALPSENCRIWKCGCQKLDQMLELHRQMSIRCGIWLQLISKSQSVLERENRWMPELHHMHLHGYILPICDVHLIMYKPPVYGSHHFSLRRWGLSDRVEGPTKKPHWVSDLHNKRLLPDMEAVVLALNCATAAKVLLESQLGIRSPLNHFYGVSMLQPITWHTLAMFVASVSTAIYIILQFFHRLISYVTEPCLMPLSEVFRQGWKNVHIRSCQFLYWPVLLRGCGFSSRSNVEYAHGVALCRHFMWSSVAIDIFLGTIVGVLLLANIEAICFLIAVVVHDITDNLLRSGCVWLMGVPAGFKLNTELAELLGMISLNAIQVFSTLWVCMGSFFKYSIAGIALSGVFLGLTVPAALCIDMLKFTTLHIFILHWAISFLYSHQIKALVSLWRLFRGKKWNPLRQRLDSYGYTVEQHVVGSLIFTPLLLLLPTTSVFYIFFTILYAIISFICIMIEITISMLHATPYAEVLLWMAMKRRFPSGIWFKIISVPTVSDGSLSSSTLDHKSMGYSNNGQPKTVVSLLNSNHATIGQIIGPRYRNIFRGVSPSFVKSSVYGILIGQRTSSTLQTSLPSTMPWMHMTIRDYWRLCYSSVLSCRS